MTTNDLKFIPHSDMSIDDLTIVNEHQNLIDSNKFSDATALLNNNNYLKGFRAFIFNNIQNRINTVQNYLKDKDTEKEEIIAQSEPVSDKQFWLQDY